MIGIARQPFGISPLGVGAMVDLPPLPARTSGAKFIGPTGDYEIDPATGEFARMPPVVQRVVLALSTALGSSTAAPGLGVVAPIKRGATFESEAKNSALSALREMIQAGEITILSITVTFDLARRAIRTVKFRDNSTGDVYPVSSEVSP